jgi:queuine tRNA-ribosyltransferase
MIQRTPPAPFKPSIEQGRGARRAATAVSAPAFRFELLATDGAARRGRLHTAHGTVETPAFMPVGTAATVKAMTPAMLRQTGADMVLANTYHLMLRPGAERIARLGGLHRFMAWPGPILTDSGGYQVMSLAERRTLDEDGVTFASHLDGSRHRLTPERAVAIQELLDATVTMVLDECTPWPIERAAAAASMRRSMRWAERSRAAFRARPGYGLFGIVQGSTDPELRLESAARLVEIGFDGHAIGGLAVGEGQALMLETVALTTPALPPDRPRYLMGVGRPEDLVGAVLRGVDLFDCVLPTRSGRTAQAWTRGGPLNLRNARHADDPRPLDPACACPVCALHSRAYLHHLVRAGEILAAILLTSHNLFHYQALMAALRTAIERGELAGLARRLAAERAGGDLAPWPGTGTAIAGLTPPPD